MDQKMHDKGLAVRKAVLGETYVNNALKNVDDFNKPFQDLLNEYCWGSVWGRDELPRKTRSMLNIAMISILNRPHELRAHIKGALTKFGVKVADEGWTIDPASAVTENVTECMAMDSGPGGSFCVEASNGPICIRISSYCIDPADLDLILRNACEAADVALRSFDPDMDADIDLPGAGEISDPDGDAPGESDDEDAGLTEATEDPAPEPAAVTTDSKEPVMATATQEAAGQVAEAQIPVSAGDPGPTGVATNTNTEGTM